MSYPAGLYVDANNAFFEGVKNGLTGGSYSGTTVKRFFDAVQTTQLDYWVSVHALGTVPIGTTRNNSMGNYLWQVTTHQNLSRTRASDNPQAAHSIAGNIESWFMKNALELRFPVKEFTVRMTERILRTSSDGGAGFDMYEVIDTYEGFIET